MQSLIEYLVKALVDEPDQVTITEVAQEEATTYEVRVAPGDLGKVIGKQGRIANALAQEFILYKITTKAKSLTRVQQKDHVPKDVANQPQRRSRSRLEEIAILQRAAIVPLKESSDTTRLTIPPG